MQDLFQYIDEHKDSYIKWLEEICRQPSVAAQNRGMEETAQMVETYIKQVGGQAKRIETAGYPVVYGQFDGQKSKTLSFYNHYDVQPEDPVELWESPPFEPDIRDGKLFARGTADNKGNLIARLAAVDAFLNVKGELPLNLKFIVEGEEEIGSPSLAGFVEKHQDLLEADGCIWEFGSKDTEGHLQISNGVKGMCYVELTCHGANTDLHSSNAAIVENPAWRLIWALSTIKSQDEKVNIKGFYDKVLTPTDEEKEILEKMTYRENETLNNLGLSSFLLDLSGLPLKEKLTFQPTCTICGIDSGYTGEGSKTVLPSKATAKIDFRLVPNQDPYEIRDLLRQHLDEHGYSDIEVDLLWAEYAAKTAPDNALAQSVTKTAKQVYGKEPTQIPISPATGPMYVLCQQQGIPSVSVGVSNATSRNHAPNENIILEDFVEGIKHIAAIIDDFAK